MTNFTIREATDQDREWAARLMAGSEPWVRLGRGYDACLAACCARDDELYIGWMDTLPCAFVLVRPRGVAGAPYIVSVAVADPFRSRGFGASLLSFVERRFAGHSRHLFLCVSSFNARAQAFYQRHGFAVVGELEDFIIPGAAEILMQKPLDPRLLGLP